MNFFANMVRTFDKKEVLLIAPILAVGLFLLIGGGDNDASSEPVNKVAHEKSKEGEVQFWTCSMHPQIRKQNPGLCPLCGMDLIPVDSGEEGGNKLGRREIKLSAYAEKLAGIQVSPVERGAAVSEVRLSGKIEYDETSISHITAWVPGRIEQMHVDFTGTSIHKSAPMVSIYSPELYSAQQELFSAWKAYHQLKNSTLASIRRTSWKTVEAAREKLRLLGLSKGQIKKMEQRGKPREHVTVNSPMSGVVIDKNGVEGMYVDTGTRLYTICDLSRVWVKMDAYESDLVWLREGQEVEITAEAYPGETFKGKIEFIDPFLNQKTRTAKVRVTIPNPDKKLKPDMFVHGVVRPTTEDVQRVAGEQGKESVQPLVIPASAPLITGKRAVVYVSDPEKEGVYEGREIVLGPRAGDHYLVREGLSEGEMVVKNGAFKIDSAVQIMAKPSMMNPVSSEPEHKHDSESKDSGAKEPEPEHEKHKTFHAPDEFKHQLDAVFKACLEVQKALSKDNIEEAKSGAKKLQETLAKVDMKLLEGEAHMEWMKRLKALNQSAKEIAEAPDIKKARSSFKDLSEGLIEVAETFGVSKKTELFVLHCPMAFDNQGADWLQDHKEVENPYYGGSMYRCGEVKGKLSPVNKKDESEGHQHE